MLETFNLTQHISLPIRKGEKLIDHIISNTTFQSVYENVMTTDEISDPDMSFVILSIK